MSPAHSVSLQARHACQLQPDFSAFLASCNLEYIASAARVDLQSERQPSIIVSDVHHASTDVHPTAAAGHAPVSGPAVSAAAGRADADAVHDANAAAPAAAIVMTGPPEAGIGRMKPL